MITSRRYCAAAAIVALGLALGGCGEPEETLPSIAPMPEISELDQQMLSLIEWIPGEDGIPLLAFQPPIDVLEPATRVIWEGDGESIDEGDPIMFQFVVYNGQDGSVIDSTYEQGKPESLIVTPDTTDPVLFEALTKVKAGANLLYATPGTFTPAEGEDAAVPGTSSGANILAITVELVAELPPAASGETVAPVEGLPTVADSDNGPVIEIPDAEPPADLVSQDIIKGAGAPVEEGQTVAARYTGWIWDGSRIFDTNWAEDSPAVLSLDAVVEGWKQGIVGHTVGSRVLTIVPPGLGYGGAGNEVVPPGATLVFVTDILAAY
ncbi:MAG: FKBP-type peptidyl-prolyl cis-trans isomerase [Bifidobacteriaceae bacterium]|jgi:peptidylprolyl isomerase|nr:FKBP-type peptidyl-prolyl cis-trans isomerase [Bifidobacteriaceae bacterium]